MMGPRSEQGALAAVWTAPSQTVTEGSTNEAGALTRHAGTASPGIDRRSNNNYYVELTRDAR